MRAVSLTTTPFIIGAALLFAGSAGGRIMPTTIAIPQSVQIEHEAIHTALVEATKAAGPATSRPRTPGSDSCSAPSAPTSVITFHPTKTASPVHQKASRLRTDDGWDAAMAATCPPCPT